MHTFKLTFIIIILFSAACTHQVTVEDTEIDDDLLYLKSSSKPYTGEYIILYKNSDSPKGIFKCKRGSLEGPATGYYKNGKLKWQGNYKRGFMDGKWNFWNSDGRLLYELHFKNDSLDGNFICMDYTGKVVEKCRYSKNFKID